MLDNVPAINELCLGSARVTDRCALHIWQPKPS